MVGLSRIGNGNVIDVKFFGLGFEGFTAFTYGKPRKFKGRGFGIT
jgi:hypothetical protein